MYIFGGIVRDRDDVLQDLNDMYVLDTETFVWTREQCINTPSPRCAHKMISLRGKLYLFGGGAGQGWVDTFCDMYIYDPKTKVWAQPAIAENVDTCAFPCMFALDPFIFIFGGQRRSEKGCCSDVVYCYDVIAHAWHTVHPATPFKPEPRDMATMAVCGQSTFLFGGFDKRCFDDIYFLHLTKSASHALSDLQITSPESDD